MQNAVLKAALGVCWYGCVRGQVQLSLALFDSRRKRVGDEGDCLLSGDAADSASQQLNGTLNNTTRYDAAAAAAAAQDTNLISI